MSKIEIRLHEGSWEVVVNSTDLHSIARTNPDVVRAFDPRPIEYDLPTSRWARFCAMLGRMRDAMHNYSPVFDFNSHFAFFTEIYFWGDGHEGVACVLIPSPRDAGVFEMIPGPYPFRSSNSEGKLIQDTAYTCADTLSRIFKGFGYEVEFDSPLEDY